MKKRPKTHPHELRPLQKAATGIQGLDEITNGGLPKGRTTIVCGGPGCGKTMIGIEFLVRGALEFNEPGVLMAFEETPEDIASNVASLGFDIEDLAAKKKLYLDYISVDPSDLQEAGDYDLEGLSLRLRSAVEAVGAKRVMFDTLEALFTGFSNPGVLRSEFRRLFRWLKDQGLTALVTAERGEGTLTRHGLEEYVSDCVILLDHRIQEQISVRRMRIVKYRGTKHGADEYPFLIDERGMSVLPVTALQLQHGVSDERVSSGVPDLDEMLEGKGYYRGSTVLLSGTAGSGKTTLAAAFADATCRMGERCLYIDFEESAKQVERNMKSVGIDLGQWARKGLLFHEAWRPTQFGMEMHLLRIHKLIDQIKPKAVILDPITNLMSSSTEREVYSVLLRLIDTMKSAGITAVFVSLTGGGETLERTNVGISSLTDTWILLRDLELNGERNRCVYVLKSRGMAHSNQLREFRLTSNGIHLVPAYIGSAGVLTGSSRMAQEAKEKADALLWQQEVQRKQQQFARKRLAIEAQVEVLQAELAEIEQEAKLATVQEKEREDELILDRRRMAESRRSGERAADD
ncbi:MAG TPA: circadian clock protein KaiC [Candidatus Acidoferrales bacterium]|jgi:circadian clock protein KaiC|nr:circadian clock protein KaiC [Candidatus Acidoferrales bacterium]